MIKEKTDLHIEGAVFWKYQDSDASFNASPTFNCGHFNISLDNPQYNTDPLNISYETYTQLSLSLQLELL